MIQVIVEIFTRLVSLIVGLAIGASATTALLYFFVFSQIERDALMVQIESIFRKK